MTGWLGKICIVTKFAWRSWFRRQEAIDLAFKTRDQEISNLKHRLLERNRDVLNADRLLQEANDRYIKQVDGSDHEIAELQHRVAWLEKALDDERQANNELVRGLRSQIVELEDTIRVREKNITNLTEVIERDRARIAAEHAAYSRQVAELKDTGKK